MPQPLKIQHLRQFLLAADHGSFRLAAEGTFRSQAAVSAAMQDLEQQLGAPLFEPGKRAQLTPLGAAVAPLAQAFPGVVVDGAVDRSRLAEALGRDEEAAQVMLRDWLSREPAGSLPNPRTSDPPPDSGERDPQRSAQD